MLKQKSSNDGQGSWRLYFLYAMSCRLEFVDRFRLGVVTRSFILVRRNGKCLSNSKKIP